MKKTYSNNSFCCFDTWSVCKKFLYESGNFHTLGMLSIQKFLIMRYFTRINATNNTFQSFWKILKISRLMRLSLERKNGKISWIVDFFTYLFLLCVQNDKLFYVKVIYHVISNHILQTFKIKGAAEISKWKIIFSAISIVS